MLLKSSEYRPFKKHILREFEEGKSYEEVRDTYFKSLFKKLEQNQEAPPTPEELQNKLKEIDDYLIKNIYNDKESMKTERLRKAEEIKDQLRKGVKCNYIKLEMFQESQKDNKKLKYTILFGVAGLAVNSNTSMTLGYTPVELYAVLKVVPNGVVIAIDSSDEIRIPFNQILRADKIINNMEIKLLEGKNIFLTDCEKGNEVNDLINEYAKGIDEEGWI